MGGGPTGQQKALTGAETGLVKQETEAAKFGLGEAKANLPAAASLLRAPLKFFQALLTGDRATVMEALGPEISTVTSQWEQGRQSAEEFAPRSGGRAAALEEMPFERAKAIENLVQGARLTGASGVSGIGAQLAGLGLGELSGGTAAAGTGGGIAGQAQADILAQRQQQEQQAQSTGEAIGGVLALLAGMA